MIIDTPLFILGNPRSGTTLLRLMLNAHSKLTIPPECGFLVWWHAKYKDWGKSDSADMKQIDGYITDLKTSKKIETWDLDYTLLKELIITSKPADYAELSSLVYTSYSLQKGKNIKLWGDKNNYYIKHLDDLLDIYPEAYFIHIIRDGRDVACSYRALDKLQTNSPYKPILPVEIKSIAEEWMTNILNITAFFNKINIKKKLTLRYEYLIDSPEKELTSICRYLGLTFDPGMLKYYEQENEPGQLIDWKKKTREAPDSKNKNKYLSILSQYQLKEFNGIAGPLLTRLGYGV